MKVAPPIPEAYAPFAEPIFAAFPRPTAATTDVGEVLWRAANDTTGQLRFPAGADALALTQSRETLGYHRSDSWPQTTFEEAHFSLAIGFSIAESSRIGGDILQ